MGDVLGEKSSSWDSFGEKPWIPGDFYPFLLLFFYVIFPLCDLKTGSWFLSTPTQKPYFIQNLLVLLPKKFLNPVYSILWCFITFKNFQNSNRSRGLYNKPRKFWFFSENWNPKIYRLCHLYAPEMHSRPIPYWVRAYQTEWGLSYEKRPIQIKDRKEHVMWTNSIPLVKFYGSATTIKNSEYPFGILCEYFKAVPKNWRRISIYIYIYIQPNQLFMICLHKRSNRDRRSYTQQKRKRINMRGNEIFV